jgi:hypothetical protein
MSLGRGITIDSRAVVEHFYADFDRARISLANSGLQIHEHLFATKLRAQEREMLREYLDRESHYVWGQRYLLKVIDATAHRQSN